MGFPNSVRWLALMTAVATLTIATDTRAAVIPVVVSAASLIKNDGTVYDNEGSPAVGSFNGTFNANAGFSFQLPIIPAGEQVDSIVFHSGNSSSYWTASTLVNLPSDVYGLGVSGSSGFAGAEYGSGTNQPGTRLSTGWFTGTIGPMADVDVTGFVTSAGYVAGNYLRLRTGTTASEATITGSAARWWTDRNDARLTITTSPVPEPTLAGIVGMSGLLLLRRRLA